jgi:hypothetical protein
MKRAAVLFFLIFSVSLFCQQAQKSVRFFKPNYGWAVEVPFQGFAIKSASAPDTDSLKVEAVDEQNAFIIDVYFEKGAADAQCAKVRDYYLSVLGQSGAKMESINKWESKSLAYVLYKAKDAWVTPKGDELNGDAYFSQGMTWVDVRIRKPYPKEGDEELVKELLQSVKLLGGFEPASEDNIFMGAIFCQSGYGNNCLACLKQAYDSEKKVKGLPRDLRIALCENFANVLRVAGELDKAMEVLNYGLNFDKNYPMYFWVKARVFADLVDEDHTVEMLKLAFDNRQYLLPGEKLPDPRQDEAFKVLGMKDSFRAKVSKIYNAAPQKTEAAPEPEERKADK